MSTLFSQTEADARVIRVLMREMYKLKGVIMAKIIVSTDGNVYEVRGEAEALSPEAVQNLKSDLQAQLDALNSVTQPANDAPAEPATPAEPVQGMTTEQQAAPEQAQTPATPADGQATPADQGQASASADMPPLQ